MKIHVAMLKHTDKESFERGFRLWFIKWENFLNERSLNLEIGKSHFTHKRLRSGYRSLSKNINGYSLGMIIMN